MIQPLVICADVGSIAKGNFAWWSSDALSGSTATGLAERVAAALNVNTPVALGFECPLFLPFGSDETKLTSARPGEGTRAWSAGAGCGALATGLVQVAWVLREIRSRLSVVVPAFLDWPSFNHAGSGLLIWEAFVSGSAKGTSHVGDAEIGARAFLLALPNPPIANMIKCQSAVYSLAGAALLRTGWSTDLSLLEQPTIVISPAPDAA